MLKADIEINIPSNAALGRYKLHFFHKTSAGLTKKAETKVYILANPFDELGGCFYEVNF